MYKENDIKIEYAYTLIPGIIRIGEGFIFSVEADIDARVELLLYKSEKNEEAYTILFPDSYHTGSVWSIYLTNLEKDIHAYNYRINGTIIQDPYATAFIGRSTFGEFTPKGICCRLPLHDINICDSKKIDFNDMIIYKLNIRTFTMKRENLRSTKGTFKAAMEMIPYWKNLGINTLMLMPVYEYNEKVFLKKEENAYVKEILPEVTTNVWGYTSGYYFAPKASYCETSSPEKEFSLFINNLHEAGMSCILEFYFEKTASELLIIQVLRYWKSKYGIDGFRILGRKISAESFYKDPYLCDVKIICEEAEHIVDERDNRERKAAIYKRDFLFNMRKLLKSDLYSAKDAVTSILQNNPYFAPINFMSDQDGFTMYDMVSYQNKHNEDNGHRNRDGWNYNCTWNCGIEGKTDDPIINDFRKKQLRNSFLMLLLSQGVPLIYSGDEQMNTQDGNNNAYCQDNDIGWIDWGRDEGKLEKYVKRLIEFRKEHPILHKNTILKGSDWRLMRFPEISFHSEEAWKCGLDEEKPVFAILYNGMYAEKPGKKNDDMIYVIYNFYWKEKEIAVPNLPVRISWEKVFDTQREEYFGGESVDDKLIDVSPRSIVVLVGKQEE